MTDLIVETDLGHDPDDFFALCYLAAAASACAPSASSPATATSSPSPACW